MNEWMKSEEWRVKSGVKHILFCFEMFHSHFDMFVIWLKCSEIQRRFRNLQYLDYQPLESLISFNITQFHPQWPQAQGSVWHPPETKNVTVDFIQKYNTNPITYEYFSIVDYTLLWFSFYCVLCLHHWQVLCFLTTFQIFYMLRFKSRAITRVLCRKCVLLSHNAITKGQEIKYSSLFEL